MQKLTITDLRNAAERLKNWGRFGPDDEIGTLNYTTAEDIVPLHGSFSGGKVMSLHCLMTVADRKVQSRIILPSAALTRFA